MDSKLDNVVEEQENDMFDQQMASSSDEDDHMENDDNENGEAKVARPTTKPTDKGRKYEK